MHVGFCVSWRTPKSALHCIASMQELGFSFSILLGEIALRGGFGGWPGGVRGKSVSFHIGSLSADVIAMFPITEKLCKELAAKFKNKKSKKQKINTVVSEKFRPQIIWGPKFKSNRINRRKGILKVFLKNKPVEDPRECFLGT
jgi:hypothetical protein